MIDYGFGWDTLTAQTIPTMANVAWTRVDLDLYITNRVSGLAPTSDPMQSSSWIGMLPSPTAISII